MILNRLTGLTLCALLAAAPVFAQQEPPAAEGTEGATGTETDAPELPKVASCGGEPAVWIANAAETSDISVADGPLQMTTGAHAANGALVAFRVTGDAQEVRVEAAGTQGGDPFIALMTEDGDVIAENDDAEDSLNSRIQTTLGPGDYCVRVASVGGGGIAADLRVGQTDHPPLFSGSSSASAMACDASTEAVALVEGALDQQAEQGVVAQEVPGDQTRYLRFTLAKPLALTLRASSDSLDPTVTLFDASGATVASNDDADGTNSRLDFPSALPAGEYCLGVAALSTGPSPIRVSAEKLDTRAYFAAAHRRGEIAPPLNGDYPVQELDVTLAAQHPVLLGGSAVWFTFKLDEPAVIGVDAYGSVSGVDPKLALFGLNGNVIAQNDDFGDTMDSRLPLTKLEAGQYMLALTNVSQSDQPGAPVRAVMLVTERYLPAK